MERVARPATLVPKLWRLNRDYDFGDLWRDFLFRLLPNPLGPLGPLHADSIGRLEYRARLSRCVPALELSLAAARPGRPDRDEPDVDDRRRITSGRDRDCRAAARGPAQNGAGHTDRHLLLRCRHLLHLRERSRFA